MLLALAPPHSGGAVRAERNGAAPRRAFAAAHPGQRLFQLRKDRVVGQVECLHHLVARPFRGNAEDDSISRGVRSSPLTIRHLPLSGLRFSCTPASRAIILPQIASYGIVHAYAEARGLSNVAKLLQQTLDEEKQTDQKLNQLAISDINKKAIQVSQKAA